MTIGRILLVLLGIVFLLPGVCSLAFSPFIFQGPDPGLVLIWLSGLAIAAFGIWMIRRAFRKPADTGAPKP
jgi:hypothetical protein